MCVFTLRRAYGVQPCLQSAVEFCFVWIDPKDCARDDAADPWVVWEGAGEICSACTHTEIDVHGSRS